MKTEEVKFDVSEDILASLKSGVEDFKREIRLIAAIAYYREKKLSLGQAAQLAEMNRLDFIDLLAEKRIKIFDLNESAAKVEVESARKIAK